MKRIFPIILIVCGFLFFGTTFIVAVYSDKLPQLLATYGFILLGYLSLIFFTIGVMQLYKQKAK